EADVVEHDLVEPGPGRSRCDRDGVVPHATVVRVDPLEARARRPDRAVGAPDRHIGPGAGEVGVLEHDHAPDDIDALAVHLAHDLPRVVVVAHGAGLPRERDTGRVEADLAALV